MGIPWDGMGQVGIGMGWDGNGTDKSVPWTSLVICHKFKR